MWEIRTLSTVVLTFFCGKYLIKIINMKNNKEQSEDANKTSPVEVEAIAAEILPSRQRIQKRYPDRQFEKDEDWESGYNSAFDEDEETIKRYKTGEDSINELLTANPDVLEFLVDIKENKMPVKIAVAKHFGVDYAPSETEEDYEEWQKMYDEKAAQSKEKTARAAMLEKNARDSDSALDKFYEEQGYTDEEKVEFEEAMSALFQKLANNELDHNFFTKFNQARNYESDIKSAEEAARISAKNERIEKNIEKERLNERGDGLPAGINTEETDEMPRGKSFYGNAVRGGFTDFNKLAKPVK
jgi:hypothetical protein